MRLGAVLASPKTLAAVLLLGAVFILAVLSYPLCTGRVYIEDDLSAFNLPLRFFYQHCLQHGDSPVWMPSMFCGFYLHGEGQAGMFHPLHWLVYRFLPLSVAFNLELLINYPLLFAGTYLLLRRWRIPASASLLGALLFAFCGFNHTNYLHIMMPSVIAYTPWLLLCIDTALRATNRQTVYLAALGVTALTALQLLLGFPQCVYFSSLIEGLYVLLLLRFHRNLKTVLILGAGKAVAMLIGAVQLLPQWEAANQSIRLAPSLEFIMAGSLHPMNLLQIFSPYLFNRHGWVPDLSQLWDPPYFTAMMPLLLIWLALRYIFLVGETSFHEKRSFPKPLQEKRTIAALLAGCCILGVLGLVLALGKYGYIYRLAAYVPVLNKFRNASRHLLLFHLAAAAAMAIAFSDLTELARSGERIAWRRLCPLALPLLISVLIAAGVVWIRARPDSQAFRIVNPHLAPTANAWTGVALSAAALALVIAAARGRSWALLGILAFTLCDISLYGLRHKPSADLTAFINAIEIPADTPEYRIDPDFRPVYAYTGPTMRGFRVVMGYAAMNPTSALDYYHQLAALRVAGVKWRKTRLGGAPELAQAADQGIDWLEVPDPMPRARFVSQCLVTGNPRRDIENIDLTTVALVNAPIDLSPGPPGTATITEDRPGRIRIGTTTPATQLLVIAERWHQGWKAEIDGAPQALVPVNGDFMGCVVPPGSHEVNLRFEPASLRYETWLTILGLALLALATAATLSLRGN